MGDTLIGDKCFCWREPPAGAAIATSASRKSKRSMKSKQSSAKRRNSCNRVKVLRLVGSSCGVVLHDVRFYSGEMGTGRLLCQKTDVTFGQEIECDVTAPPGQSIRSVQVRDNQGIVTLQENLPSFCNGREVPDTSFFPTLGLSGFALLNGTKVDDGYDPCECGTDPCNQNGQQPECDEDSECTWNSDTAVCKKDECIGSECIIL